MGLHAPAAALVMLLTAIAPGFLLVFTPAIYEQGDPKKRTGALHRVCS